MAKSVALAYSIAGTAIAAAVIVIAASTVGLVSGNEGGEVDVFETGAITTPSLDAGVSGSQIVTTASGEQVEYVYVDEPASRSHDDDDDDHDDDHDDDDDDDDHERYEHEEEDD